MTSFFNFQETTPKNKSKTCRICAIESENGQKLFNSNSEIQRIAVKICSFISIKLENIQIYPNWICSHCQLQFEKTYNFFEVIRNGQNKLREQFVFPRKSDRKLEQTKVNMFTVNDDQLDGPSSDNLGVVGKRIPKIPEKFKDSMQGNELEDIYSQIGITKRRTRQSKTETIALIEDEDGVTLGEMLYIAQESNSNSTRYQCDFCKEIFVREFAFYNHLSNHTNIIYECTECQALFQAKAMFDDHVRETNHIGLGIIETPRLEIPSGNNQDEKNSTLPQEKEQYKKFVCIKCPKSFRTNLAMQRHQKTHSENRPFKCDICLAEFKRKSGLKVHRTSHAKEHPFECHKCLKRFSNNRSLQMHLQGIHEGLNPYSCPICKKCFSQKSNLEIHKRIHTGERPYICLKCGASFKTSSQCHLHQKTHAIEEVLDNENEVTPIKRIDCKICGQLFTQRSNMIKHLRTHTGEKPYTCNLCQQKFADSSNLKKHNQNHHKKENRKNKPISLLKQNLTVASSNTDPDPDALIPPNSFSILENVVLSNANNSLMDAMNEDDKIANQWKSDVIVTDIPNDDNSIAQQQQQQEMLMDQLFCISYQDPMNPVGSTKTFYVFNSGN